MSVLAQCSQSSMSEIYGIGTEVVRFLQVGATLCAMLGGLLWLLRFRLTRALRSLWSPLWAGRHRQPLPLPAQEQAVDGRPCAVSQNAHGADRPTCPICLETVWQPVQTNCGHSYCVACILGFWRSRSPSSGVHCPYCRTYVSIITATRPQELPASVHQELLRYTAAASGGPERRRWFGPVREVPVLLRWWVQAITGARGTEPFDVAFGLLSWVTLAHFSVALVYVLVPVDFLPEIFFGVLGLLDDALVLALMLLAFAAKYRAMLIEQARVAQDHPD
eukprot:RCo035884